MSAAMQGGERTWAEPDDLERVQNNRANSVRIPAGGRYEALNADGAVNPYLAAAPNEGNFRSVSEDERKSKGMKFLLQVLQESASTSDADLLIENMLGKEFHGEFIRYKTEEWGRVTYLSAPRISSATAKCSSHDRSGQNGG